MAHGDIRKALGLSVGDNLGLHRTYRIWKAMLARCNSDWHHASHRYKSRGISVDERWNSFLLFLEDMGHPPTPEHSLDRIDCDGNYCKSNCRWATQKEQNNNRTDNIVVKQGQSLKAACDELGLNYQTVWRRVKRGWSIQRALNQTNL